MKSSIRRFNQNTLKFIKFYNKVLRQHVVRFSLNVITAFNKGTENFNGFL